MSNKNNISQNSNNAELTDKELREAAKIIAQRREDASVRKGLSISGAMFHVTGEELRRYYDAVDDVLRYIMYSDCTEEQALYSALELQNFCMDELYERSQSHNF